MPIPYEQTAEEFLQEWQAEEARIKQSGQKLRLHSAFDTVALRVPESQSKMPDRFRELVKDATANKSYFNALSAVTTTQARQLAESGMPAIYISGWQIAAAANPWAPLPDQSLHPKNAVPDLVRAINKMFDEVDHQKHLEFANKVKAWHENPDKNPKPTPFKTSRVPLVVDIDAGFGNVESTRMMASECIKAGAAVLHLEDQKAEEKKCGHMGGKTLVPMQEHIEKLGAMRLAADELKVPVFIISRTDALDSKYISAVGDAKDWDFLKLTEKQANDPDGTQYLRRDGKDWKLESPGRGLYTLKSQDEDEKVRRVVARHKAFWPYADMLWTETPTANLELQRKISAGVHAVHPDAVFAYNNSPSFNWSLNFRQEVLAEWKKAQKPGVEQYENVDVMKLPDNNPVAVEADRRIAAFQTELGKLGVPFDFITLSAVHNEALSLHKLAKGFRNPEQAMLAYVKDVQREEIKAGLSIVTHQKWAGVDLHDAALQAATGGTATHLLAGGHGSTEAQFAPAHQEQRSSAVAAILANPPAASAVAKQQGRASLKESRADIVAGM